MFPRVELVDKDELFPGNPLLPSFRIGAYTFGGARDLVQSQLGQLALGADLTLYSKPLVWTLPTEGTQSRFRYFLEFARPCTMTHTSRAGVQRRMNFSADSVTRASALSSVLRSHREAHIAKAHVANFRPDWTSPGMMVVRGHRLRDANAVQVN